MTMAMPPRAQSPVPAQSSAAAACDQARAPSSIATPATAFRGLIRSFVSGEEAIAQCVARLRSSAHSKASSGRRARGPRHACELLPRRGDRQLLCARQALERALEPEGVSLAGASPRDQHAERAAAPGVAGASPGVVLRDSRGDVSSDAHVERVVGAPREVDRPIGHDPHSTSVARGSSLAPCSLGADGRKCLRLLVPKGRPIDRAPASFLLRPKRRLPALRRTWCSRSFAFAAMALTLRMATSPRAARAQQLPAVEAPTVEPPHLKTDSGAAYPEQALLRTLRRERHYVLLGARDRARRPRCARRPSRSRAGTASTSAAAAPRRQSPSSSFRRRATAADPSRRASKFPVLVHASGAGSRGSSRPAGERHADRRSDRDGARRRACRTSDHDGGRRHVECPRRWPRGLRTSRSRPRASRRRRQTRRSPSAKRRTSCSGQAGLSSRFFRGDADGGTESTPTEPAQPAEPTEEVLVKGEHPTREVTRRTLGREEIEHSPGTHGDALLSLQNLPGVARPPPFNGALVVRGSAPDDTNIFIDGTNVPLVYHFGGLSSVVPTELLEKIDFYPGNYSAQYGRGMGGIVDVGIRDPKRDGYHVLVPDRRSRRGRPSSRGPSPAGGAFSRRVSAPGSTSCSVRSSRPATPGTPRPCRAIPTTRSSSRKTSERARRFALSSSARSDAIDIVNLPPDASGPDPRGQPPGYSTSFWRLQRRGLPRGPPPRTAPSSA